MRKTFTILIMPAESDEDGYWVKVPALPDCVTQGETVEEALSNAKEAVEAYVLERPWHSNSGRGSGYQRSYLSRFGGGLG